MKGFYCVDYRSRERHTGVGKARKRALSGCVNLISRTEIVSVEKVDLSTS